MNIGELLATLGLNTAKMQKDLNKANREFKKFSSKSAKEMGKVERRWKGMVGGLGKIKGAISGLVRAIGPLGAALGVGGLGLLIGSSIKSFAAFEEQMAKIASLTPHVNKVMGEMAESIKDVGIQYGIAREEIAKAGFDIVSAGAAGEDLTKTNEILAASAELAKAGFASMDVATSALITSLQIYGDELGTARRAAEFFFNVQKFGRTDVDQLSSVFGRFASVAKALGVEINLLGATFATLTLQGIPIEQVATQLTGVLSTFTRKQTPDAIRALKELGVEMNSASLQGGGLLRVLEDLSTVSVTQLRAIFPEEQAFRGMTFLLQQQDKLKAVLRDINKETKDAVSFQGALQGGMDLTTTKLKGLNEQWKRLQDLIGGTVVDAAEKSVDILEDLKEVAEVLGETPDPVQNWFSPVNVKNVKAFFGIIVDAITGTEEAIDEIIPHWKTLSETQLDADFGITTYSKSLQDFKDKMEGVIPIMGSYKQAWMDISDAQLTAELGGDFEVGILQIEAEAKAKQKAAVDEITTNAKFAGWKANNLAQEKMEQNEFRKAEKQALTEADREVRMILVRQLDASRQAREQQIDGTKNQFDIMEQFAIQGARGMQSAMKEFFFDAFTGEIDSLSDLLNSLWRTAAGVLANVIAEAAGQSLFGRSGSGGGSGGGIGGFVGSLFGSGGGGGAAPNIGRVTQMPGTGQFVLGKIPTKQHGGRITGPAIVGEKGPELFVPDRSGTIIPNDKLGGGGRSINQVFQITPSDPALVRAEIRRAMPMIMEQTIAAVAATSDRDVNFASRMGRR